MVADNAAELAAIRTRDETIGQLERALAADPIGGPEIATIFRASLQAARWTMRVDSADSSVLELLQTVGRSANAIAILTTALEPQELLLSGSQITVSPGAPTTVLDGLTWANGLWAATATGDAAVAVRLARTEVTGPSSAAMPGDLELAAAMAAWWTGRPIGPPLIEALRRTDPKGSSELVRDYGLDVVAPAVAAIQELAAGRDAAFFDAFRAAQTYFGNYWSADGRRDVAEGFLSLPLAGLAQMAHSFGLVVHPSRQAVPAAVLDAEVTILCCAICSQPFDDGESNCHWCRADLRADAPIETTVGQLLGETSQPCPVCEQTCRLNALWCWNCRARLR